MEALELLRAGNPPHRSLLVGLRWEESGCSFVCVSRPFELGFSTVWSYLAPSRFGDFFFCVSCASIPYSSFFIVATRVYLSHQQALRIQFKTRLEPPLNLIHVFCVCGALSHAEQASRLSTRGHSSSRRFAVTPEVRLFRYRVVSCVTVKYSVRLETPSHKHPSQRQNSYISTPYLLARQENEEFPLFFV